MIHKAWHIFLTLVLPGTRVVVFGKWAFFRINTVYTFFKEVSYQIKLL